MATSIFDRRIEINDDESADNFIRILTADEPQNMSSGHLFSDEDRKTCEQLLKHYLSCAKH